jgi:hypothetical protein
LNDSVLVDAEDGYRPCLTGYREKPSSGRPAHLCDAAFVHVDLAQLAYTRHAVILQQFERIYILKKTGWSVRIPLQRSRHPGGLYEVAFARVRDADDRLRDDSDSSERADA